MENAMILSSPAKHSQKDNCLIIACTTLKVSLNQSSPLRTLCLSKLSNQSS